MTKVCTICKEEKELREFRVGYSCKDGRQSKCKACYKVIDANRPKKEPELFSEYKEFIGFF